MSWVDHAPTVGCSARREPVTDPRVPGRGQHGAAGAGGDRCARHPAADDGVRLDWSEIVDVRPTFRMRAQPAGSRRAAYAVTQTPVLLVVPRMSRRPSDRCIGGCVRMPAGS